MSEELVHWQRLGRAHCEGDTPKEFCNPNLRLTVLCKSVTCPTCLRAVGESWNAMLRKAGHHPPEEL